MNDNANNQADLITLNSKDQQAITRENRGDHMWDEQNFEGQLSVDVYHTKDEIVIKSAIAGVAPEDLDISINNDMVTIRGTRHQDESIKENDYFYKECYFGSFSRSIILPQEVSSENATAEFKKGILTIRLPKIEQVKKIKIKVSEEA